MIVMDNQHRRRHRHSITAATVIMDCHHRKRKIVSQIETKYHTTLYALLPFFPQL